MDHDHDVPGAEPVRILPLDEGDEAQVPHEVEDALRRPVERRPSRFTRDELLEQFRDDYEASVADRLGCFRDWQQVHPDLAIYLAGIAQQDEFGLKQLPRVAASDPVMEEVAASDPVPEEVGDPSSSVSAKGCAPGYEVMQATRKELRWSAVGSAIHELTGLATNEGDEGVFEASLATRGYRIVRSQNHG